MDRHKGSNYDHDCPLFVLIFLGHTSHFQGSCSLFTQNSWKTLEEYNCFTLFLYRHTNNIHTFTLSVHIFQKYLHLTHDFPRCVGECVLRMWGNQNSTLESDWIIALVFGHIWIPIYYCLRLKNCKYKKLYALGLKVDRTLIPLINWNFKVNIFLSLIWYKT